MSQYWGNRQWYWYHMVSYTSPEKITESGKKYYLQFIYLMTQLLPCMKCYNHFKLYLKNTPIDFNDRKSMIEWFVNAHNYVNKKLEKPLLSVEESNKLYLKPSLSLDSNNTPDNSESLKNDELKDINHLLLNQFIKYHADRALYNHSSMILVSRLIEKLIFLYPCKICRDILVEYNKMNPVRLCGTYHPAFRKWYSNFFDHQDFSKHFVKKWTNLKK
jgi:hypothetical protein